MTDLKQAMRIQPDNADIKKHYVMYKAELKEQNK